MKRFIGVLLLGVAGLTSANACEFVTEYGDHANVSAAGVTITRSDGTITQCETFSGGTGVDVQGIACDDGAESYMFAASSKMGGEDDLLVTFNQVWYLERCE